MAFGSRRKQAVVSSTGSFSTALSCCTNWVLCGSVGSVRPEEVMVRGPLTRRFSRAGGGVVTSMFLLDLGVVRHGYVSCQ